MKFQTEDTLDLEAEAL
jgi:hypothetical protein